MALGDFSSLFELSVAMNFAFVAVEYASSFSNIFIKNFCKLSEHVKVRTENIEKNIDKDTLDSFEGIDINGKNDIAHIEKTRRNHETATKKLELAKKQADEIIRENSKAKCFSFFSLYFGLYSMSALFLAGFTEYGNCSLRILLLTTILSLAFLVLGLTVQRINCVPERFRQGFFGFSSLSLSVCYFVILFGLSVVLVLLGWVNLAWFNDAWLEWTPPLFALSTFMNFVVYTAILKFRAYKAEKEIKNLFDPIEKEFKEINDEILKISSVRSYGLELKSQH